MKHILYLLTIYLLSIFGFNCSGKNIKSQSKTQNIDYLIEQGNQLWDQRIDSLAFNKAEHFIALAHKQQQDNFALSIFYSKIIFARAYFLKTDHVDSMFLHGSNVCKNAIMVHNDFLPIYNRSEGDSTFKLLSAIAEAPQSVLPGLYWWGINHAMYLQNKPVLERIKQRELLEIIMHRVLSLDPSFYFSGPYRFFGLFYTRIPGVELSRSKNYFDQAIEANPEYLGNKVQLAQFYYQKSGNREKFNETLEMVISTDLTKYPEIMADNFYYQKKAKTLLKNESLLFE